MVYTRSFSKVLLVAFYYQEMASAKDKVSDTTAETEVKEVGGIKLTNVTVTDCMANFTSVKINGRV